MCSHNQVRLPILLPEQGSGEMNRVQSSERDREGFRSAFEDGAVNLYYLHSGKQLEQVISSDNDL